MRGTWYLTHSRVIRDLIPSFRDSGFHPTMDYPYPLPEKESEHFTARFDALQSFHPASEHDWIHRFAIVNRIAKTDHREELRIGVHMIDDVVLDILQKLPEGLRALRRFQRFATWANHDQTSHGAFHPNANPGFTEWSNDLLTPPIVTYSALTPIPNYELLSCIAHRKYAGYIFQQRPDIRVALINDFHALNTDMESVAQKIRNGAPLPESLQSATRASVATDIHKFMMTIGKSMFFHIISPDEPAVAGLIEKYPFIGKNNKLMRAIHSLDGIPLVSSGGAIVPSEEIIRRYHAQLPAEPVQ